MLADVELETKRIKNVHVQIMYWEFLYILIFLLLLVIRILLFTIHRLFKFQQIIFSISKSVLKSNKGRRIYLIQDL